MYPAPSVRSFFRSNYASIISIVKTSCSYLALSHLIFFVNLNGKSLFVCLSDLFLTVK